MLMSSTASRTADFQSACKLVRIGAIPRGNQIKSEKDLRPISILPAVISKVYERLTFCARELSSFVDKNNVLKSNITAHRKDRPLQTSDKSYQGFVGNYDDLSPFP